MHETEHARISKGEASPLRLNALQGRRVAVIEDDPLILNTLCKQLSHWGCEVVGGESADGIIDNDPDHAPDVILADFHLKQGRNGMGEIIAVCLHFDRYIPAGLITEDTSLDLHDEIKASGYPLLTKPIAEYRLRAMVNTLVSQ